MIYKELPEHLKQHFTNKEFKPKKIYVQIDLIDNKVSYSKEEFLEKVNKLPDDVFITLDTSIDYDDRSQLEFYAHHQRMETSEEVARRIGMKMNELNRKFKKKRV